MVLCNMCVRVVEWREVTTRSMCIKVKFGKEIWVFVNVNGPGNEGEIFWNDLIECILSFGYSVRIVL